MPEIAHHPLPSPSSFDAQTPSNYAPAPSNYAPAPSNYAPALIKSPAAASSSSAPATIKPPASANFASAPASITPPAVAGSAGASASIEPHAVAGSAGAVTKPTVSAQNEHKSAAASKPSSGSLSLGSRIADQKYEVIDKLGQGRAKCFTRGGEAMASTSPSKCSTFIRSRIGSNTNSLIANPKR